MTKLMSLLAFTEAQMKTLLTTVSTEVPALPGRSKAYHYIVNARKSNCILIGTHPRTENISNNFSVFINDNAIIRTSSLKLLGVFIDQNLNFSQHISFLVKNCPQK